jgi:hypothetical protein
MSDVVGSVVGTVIGVNAAKHYAHSALPDAPVIPEPPPREPRPHHSRRWVAARLRSTARGTRQLADRIDPACAAG